MTPDQLNMAADALTPPTGGVASSADTSEDEDVGANPGHMTNGQSHMNTSSTDEDGSIDREGELTRTEALAALRRRKGKSEQSEPLNRSTRKTAKEKGMCFTR